MFTPSFGSAFFGYFGPVAPPSILGVQFPVAAFVVKAPPAGVKIGADFWRNLEPILKAAADQSGESEIVVGKGAPGDHVTVY